MPFQLIAGEEDRAGETVSFRFRDGTQENGVPIDEAVVAHPRGDRRPPPGDDEGRPLTWARYQADEFDGRADG